MPRLTGGEIVARTLTNYGVKFGAGIPGHGIWSLLDGFLQEGSDVDILQVFHEQSGVHLADGYYRASGKPMLAITSVGPGAANAVMGLATAYADSSSLLIELRGRPDGATAVAVSMDVELPEGRRIMHLAADKAQNQLMIGFDQSG